VIDVERVTAIDMHVHAERIALALDAGLSLAEAAALARRANARVTAQVYAGLTADGCEQAAAKLVDGSSPRQALRRRRRFRSSGTESARAVRICC